MERVHRECLGSIQVGVWNCLVSLFQLGLFLVSLLCPCYLHFGARSCRFKNVCIVLEVKPLFPWYLQHFGARTVHLTVFFAGLCSLGLFRFGDLFMVCLGSIWGAFRVCLGLV